MEEFKSKLRFRGEFIPAFSPWFYGNNESIHYNADLALKLIMRKIKG